MKQITNLRAACQSCGANVGCGCNLTNGMCAYCNSQQGKPK